MRAGTHARPGGAHPFSHPASEGFLCKRMCSFTVPASLSSLCPLRQGPGSQSTERVLPGVLQAAEAREAARRAGLLAVDAVQPLPHRGADVRLRPLHLLRQQGGWLLQCHSAAQRGRRSPGRRCPSPPFVLEPVVAGSPAGAGLLTQWGFVGCRRASGEKHGLRLTSPHVLVAFSVVAPTA